jgi:hypothetical protein
LVEELSQIHNRIPSRLKCSFRGQGFSEDFTSSPVPPPLPRLPARGAGRVCGASRPAPLFLAQRILEPHFGRIRCSGGLAAGRIGRLRSPVAVSFTAAFR